MSKGKLIVALASLALIAPVVTSCGPNSNSNSTPEITESVNANAVTINLEFNKEGGSVSFAQGEYKVGNKLHLKINVNKGYSLAKVTANEEAIRPNRGNYEIILKDEIVNICVVFELNKVIMSDFKFELNEENLTAKIVEYSPDRSIIPYPFVIPETVTIDEKTYTINAIGKTAFVSSSLEAIKLSKNITDIEQDSFANVHGLSEILVDENNPKFASYDNCLYSKDFKSLIAVPCEYLNSEITIKEGCQTIKQSAFFNSRLVEKVVVPNSVTTIEDSAFASMRSLTNISLSKNVKVIPIKCFANDVTLQEIVIPEGVETLSDYCFNFCPELKKVSFPSTLKTIGKEAFYHCQKLGDIKLNEGLEVINKSAFGAILALHDIVMPSTVKYIDDACFEACSNLRNVTLNEGLEYLGGAVFILTPYIKEVVIPSTVKRINYNPFIGTGEGVLKLAPGNKNYKMVDGVLYTADLSKLVCYPYNLQPENGEFRIPDSVKTLVNNCFSMNIYLKKLIIPVSVENMYCPFEEILPSAASGNYELELHYEGTIAQFNQINTGFMPWNYKANFKNNKVHCSDGFINLAPNFGD